MVCRAISEEAMAFFYSNNQIVILPEQRPIIGAEPPIPSQHNATKLFLERLRPEVLCHIRTLELVLPRISSNSSLLGEDAFYSEWCLAVDYLAAHVNVPRLTLIIHISTVCANGVEPWQPDRAVSVLKEQCPHFLAPLRRLSHMRRLFVHLEWPWQWSPPRLLKNIETLGLPKQELVLSSPGWNIGWHYMPGSVKPVAEMEVWLEKVVMGAEYNSNALGKEDELPSPWLHTAWDKILFEANFQI